MTTTCGAADRPCTSRSVKRSRFSPATRCRRSRSRRLARDASLPIDARVAMIESLARAAGWSGMVGGQTFDIDATGRKIALDALEAMHRAKTGALLTTAVELGALAAGAIDRRERRCGIRRGDRSRVSSRRRSARRDRHHRAHRQARRRRRRAGKNTFPGLLGIDGRANALRPLHREAIDALHRAGIESGPLYAIARTIVDRTH